MIMAIIPDYHFGFMMIFNAYVFVLLLLTLFVVVYLLYL